MTPKAIQLLADELAHLPGIGPRQALRIAYYLARSNKADVASLARSVGDLSSIKTCSDCFMLHDGKETLCNICSDTKRSPTSIAIVEKETDLMSLEKSKAFSGKYLILGELKKDGTLEQSHRLRLARLKERITKECAGSADEIILALSPTTFGDLNASLLLQEVKGLAKKITRLGRGIPTGGEIEFADEETLLESLKHRA